MVSGTIGWMEILRHCPVWATGMLALAEQWRQQADFIIILEGFINSDWQTFLNSGKYSEVLRIKDVFKLHSKFVAWWSTEDRDDFPYYHRSS